METVLRSVAIHLVLLVVMRLSGRRTLGQISTLDVVLLLIVAETVQPALLSDDNWVTNAIVLIVTLFSIDAAFSHVRRASQPIDRWLDGRPSVLVGLGRPDVRALGRARIGLDEVLEATHRQFGLEQVTFAVRKTDRRISIAP